MPLLDLPLAEFRAFRSASEPPQDLPDFRGRTLEEDMVVHPDNGHEGGGAEHDERSLHWLSDRLA